MTVTAFGPFAETVEVDFDTLSGSGLFLLCGPTGAGKTSVLDAVCFALYGDVPGDRADAKRLRSDLAAAGVTPRVQLELSLAGRRFRLTRSPQWTRPKRRGTGTTRQHASVLVEERLDDAWVALSTRLDEAGHLVHGLVGMTMTQFCQVAMLPQGRFQAFLRASSDERHQLLTQLFSTQRFADIETWLRERARSLHRASEAQHRQVSAIVSRLLEAGDATLPEDWRVDALTSPADSGQLAEWAGRLTGQAGEVATASVAGVRTATERDHRAEVLLDEGRQVALLQARHQAASAEHEALTAVLPAHEEDKARLRAARRAAPVVPLHRLARVAAERRDRAREAASVAIAAAAPVVGVPSPTAADVELAAVATRTDVTRLELLLPREDERTGLDTVVDLGTSRLQELDAQLADLETEAAALPHRVRDQRAELDQARKAARELALAQTTRADLQSRLRAHRRLVVVHGELDTTQAQCRAAVDRSQSLKESWLELREARLTGMAAEIAQDLAVGEGCPVCGSAEHPHKAEPAPDAPDAAIEKAARRAHEDAEVARVALEAKLRDLETSAARLEQEAGPDTAVDVQNDLESSQARVDELAPVAAREAGIATTLTATEEEQETLGETRRARLSERAEAASRLAVDLAARTRITDELERTLAGTGCASLAELLERTRSELIRLDDACRAGSELQSAADAAADATQALVDWLGDHGFEGESEALAAVLPEADLDRLDREIAAQDERRAAVAAVLHDPEVIDAVTRPAPDLSALVEARAEAADALSAARTAHEVATARARRLTGLGVELRAALDLWAPVREAHDLAAGLAAFAEGSSADNELRMRLSAYVLAWRLTQVVAAANERLLGMSDHRYTLEHTGRRGAGERRGGLSLLVRDEWSGDARDPATLSGGETFVVSLALALGLADVVTREAGGTDLDTLFVDEGFGSLDSDTLDGVMDTLDTLREGGRVIGVVSHVAELRTRIPTQVHVAKARVGSTLALARACD